MLCTALSLLLILTEKWRSEVDVAVDLLELRIFAGSDA